MLNRLILTIWVIVLSAAPAQALSQLTQLTRANLSHQQLAISIRCTHTSHSNQFWVTVRHKLGVPYHFMHSADGYLIDGPFANGTEGRSLPDRVTRTEHGNKSIVYHFTLPPHYRTNTRFQFGYLGCDTAPNMPVGDFYWFVVSAFSHQNK